MADRDEHGRFAKGNPGGGRPRQWGDLADKLRAAGRDLDEVVDFLYGTLRNPELPHASREWAAREILDRAVGKPVVQQITDVSVIAGAPRMPLDVAMMGPEARDAWIRSNVAGYLAAAGDDTDDDEPIDDGQG